MFRTCSKTVWRFKNEVFRRSFGDFWGMFCHHPWCLCSIWLRLGSVRKNHFFTFPDSRVWACRYVFYRWVHSFHRLPRLNAGSCTISLPSLLHLVHCCTLSGFQLSFLILRRRDVRILSPSSRIRRKLFSVCSVWHTVYSI